MLMNIKKFKDDLLMNYYIYTTTCIDTITRTSKDMHFPLYCGYIYISLGMLVPNNRD